MGTKVRAAATVAAATAVAALLGSCGTPSDSVQVRTDAASGAAQAPDAAAGFWYLIPNLSLQNSGFNPEEVAKGVELAAANPPTKIEDQTAWAYTAGEEDALIVVRRSAAVENPDDQASRTVNSGDDFWTRQVRLEDGTLVRVSGDSERSVDAFVSQFRALGHTPDGYTAVVNGPDSEYFSALYEVPYRDGDVDLVLQIGAGGSSRNQSLAQSGMLSVADLPNGKAYLWSSEQTSAVAWTLPGGYQAVLQTFSSVSTSQLLKYTERVIQTDQTGWVEGLQKETPR